MFVQCERCKSEYDFDDALVSERGTSVKCTQCGHQFKVQRGPWSQAHDVWTVGTASGKDLLVTSLRDLQKAIASGRVSPNDTLARGNAPPRRLASIPELEPFFAGRRPDPSGPVPDAVLSRPPSSQAGFTSQPGSFGRERSDTLRPAASSSAIAPPTQLSAFAASTEEPSSLPPATRPARRSAMDDLGRGSLAEEVYARPRRRFYGWILAAVLLLGVGILATVVVRRYLANVAPAPGAHTLAPLEPRTKQFLLEGEKAMLEGNLDFAKENFDKASALAERDPRVLLDVAKLAGVMADILWLSSQIDVGGANARSAKPRFDDALAKARSAADDALAATLTDPAAVRTKIDALRISADLPGARALVPRLAGASAESESAYSLAMLDVAEPQPPLEYTEILERLRLAASSEGNLGRARAALVYALARSHDAAGAHRELERLGALPRVHPLLAVLKANIDRLAASVSTDAGASSSDLSTGGGRGVVSTAGLSPSDPRVLLERADEAKNRGDLERAKSLYGQVIKKLPRDSEALAGLGDIAERQHDLANAKTYYQHALASNAGFLPGRIGLGNVMWEVGDKASAGKIYKEIVDSTPEAAYPSWVRDRAQSAMSAPAPASPAQSKPAPVTSAGEAPAGTESP